LAAIRPHGGALALSTAADVEQLPYTGQRLVATRGRQRSAGCLGHVLDEFVPGVGEVGELRAG